MTAMKPLIVAASFTADQITETLGFWSGRLCAGFTATLAPYAQIYQELLDPARQMQQNRNGANVICLRWQDMTGGDRTASACERAAQELADAVTQSPRSVPMLIVLCPQKDNPQAAALADGILVRATEGQSGITVLPAEDAFKLYAVQEPFDPQADITGHIPYTQDAMVAIGTQIARWWMARERAPIKLIAADCDNTLWQGVVGEDSIAGLRIEDGHKYLQNLMKKQAAGGRLLTLLSKNEEKDVVAAFDQHPDMKLSLDDIVSHRINWDPKPVNLQDMVNELGLGLDAVLFLDDNPAEVEAMKQLCPQVHSIQVPKNAGDFPAFLDNLWLLDFASITAEDLKRSRMYKENAARGQAQKSAGSLTEFLATLELDVQIEEVNEESLERFSQLTQRTNQFNAAMTRLSPEDVRESRKDGDLLRTIRAKDRFGDYGIVGALRAIRNPDSLKADVFLLSCRALGRGIEHEMVRALGREAEILGLDRVEIFFEKGPRNTPAAKFLQSLEPEKRPFDGTRTLCLSTIAAIASNFSGEENSAPDHPAEGSAPSPATSCARSDWQEIAVELSTAAAICRAMTGNMRPRPNLDTDFISPAPGLQADLAGLWQEVLNIERVGIRDSFAALGGKSLQFVTLHGLMRQRLGLSVDLTLLFEHATIETLAAALNTTAPVTGRGGLARAENMRAARNRLKTRQRSRQIG